MQKYLHFGISARKEKQVPKKKKKFKIKSGITSRSDPKISFLLLTEVFFFTESSKNLTQIWNSSCSRHDQENCNAEYVKPENSENFNLGVIIWENMHIIYFLTRI